MTTPLQVGKLRKGGYAMLKERPCKIVEIKTSKTGKHGHAKAVITGIDIFTGKKIVECYSTSHNIDVPVVTKITYQLCNVEGNEVEVLDESNEIVAGIKIEEDMVGELTGKFEEDLMIEVVVLSALGERKLIEYKVIKE